MAFTSTVWNLQAERSRLELEGDWARATALSEAINALGKGYKGKSGGKGGKAGKGAPAAWDRTSAWGGGKGAEKGSKGGGGGEDAAAGSFGGACHHCGVMGHRKRDCKKLDAKIAAQRQGGQGGGKGGKGLHECGAGEANTDDPAEAQDGAADEVWWFDTIAILALIRCLRSASRWQGRRGRTRFPVRQARSCTTALRH